MEDPTSTTQQVVQPVTQQVPATKAPIPDEPPAFFDTIREAGSIKEILSNELIQPHVYLILLIMMTIVVAIILSVIA